MAEVKDFTAWLERVVNDTPPGVEPWSTVIGRGDMYYELGRDTHCQERGCEAVYSCDEDDSPHLAGWGSGPRGELCPEHFAVVKAGLARLVKVKASD